MFGLGTATRHAWRRRDLDKMIGGKRIYPTARLFNIIPLQTKKPNPNRLMPRGEYRNLFFGRRGIGNTKPDDRRIIRGITRVVIQQQEKAKKKA